MKKLVTPGTGSRALRVGTMIRESRNKANDIGKEVAKTIDGHVLFRGRITEKKDEDKDGYYWGTNVVRGCGRFLGTHLQVVVQNENHVSWLDNKLFVTSPRPDFCDDSEDGEPMTIR